MNDLRFLLRCLSVALAVVIVFWAAIIPGLDDETESVSKAYCFFEDKYFSKGAIREMSGTTRICSSAGTDSETLEWLDPRNVQG